MATVVDAGRTSTYSGSGGGQGFHSPPPPIPARLHPHHHVRDSPRPATALGHDYLAPVAAVVPARRAGGPGPPLPPRAPLRRSVSLTQRGGCPATPQPGPRSAGAGPGGGGLVVPQLAGAATTQHEPSLDEVLASLRRSRGADCVHQPPALSPAVSAPLLGQVAILRCID